MRPIQPFFQPNLTQSKIISAYFVGRMIQVLKKVLSHLAKDTLTKNFVASTVVYICRQTARRPDDKKVGKVCHSAYTEHL
jgi:hypothetical protein